MPNNLTFDTQMHDKILSGVDKLVDAVAMSLGPRSRYVGIAKMVQNQIYDRVIVKDGVTIAKNIEPEDDIENYAVNILREAAQKQVDEVGDGTTVVMILAREFYKEMTKLIKAGHKPMELREGLEKGRDILLAELTKLAKPIKTLEEKIQVATISASDKELGKLVGEIVDEVGLEGVITTEESKGSETFVEKQEGMQLDKGWVSPYFVTDGENMTATLENAKIMLTDQKIENLADLQKMFEGLGAISCNTLVVIAPDFSEMALALLIKNKMEGRVQILAIKAPSFGQNQKETLQDIAVLSGATVISADTGKKLKDTTVEDLGEIGYISSDKTSTVITGGKGDPNVLKQRIEQIRTQIKNTDQNFDKEKLRERLGHLTGKIAVIRVGGSTEIEMKERKERVLDAVEATKAAVKEGIVAGGEVVYIHLLSKMGEQTLGEKILKEAIKEPFKKLVLNAGYEPGEKLSELKQQEWGTCFDVTEGEFKDAFKAGIIDPVMVSKCAISNAVSVSVQLALLGAVTIPVKEEIKK